MLDETSLFETIACTGDWSLLQLRSLHLECHSISLRTLGDFVRDRKSLQYLQLSRCRIDRVREDVEEDEGMEEYLERVCRGCDVRVDMFTWKEWTAGEIDAEDEE